MKVQRRVGIERANMDQQAEFPHSLLAHALDTISEGSIITDAHQWIVYANAAFLTISGYTMGEIRGKNCRFLQLPDSDPEVLARLRSTLDAGDVFRGDILNRRKDGTPFWNALTITPLRGADGEVTHFVSVQRDITEEVALRHEALHDAGTGLPNRIALGSFLATCFDAADRPFSLAIIDLDDFDQINETFGREAGDAVLRQVADRVHAVIGAHDFLARVGGDEFAIAIADVDSDAAAVVVAESSAGAVVAADARSGQDDDAEVGGAERGRTITGRGPSDPEVPGPAASDPGAPGPAESAPDTGGVHRMIERIRDAVEHPFLLPDGQTTTLRMSVGLARHPLDGTDELTLFRKADAELYEEKSAKEARAQWWNLPPHRAKSNDDTIPPYLAQVYRQHLTDGSLTMFMQPIVDLRTGSVRLVESLARLVTAGGEIVTAARFVPLLDDAELEGLFQFGIHEALANLSHWDAQGLTLSVSVNLDPSTLLNPLCAGWVSDALELHGIAARRLVLELLETRAVDTAEQREAIEQLRQLGIRLAIDDLGSGYSNLRRLSHFDFDIIKIDAGMLAGFRTRPLETLSLLSALTQLSHDLGRAAVVEGIEDLEMSGVVNVLGAQLGQGYLFAHPMPAKDIPGWVTRFTPAYGVDEIRTYSAALAFHWRHGRETAHPGWLEDCGLTSFLRTRADGSAIDTWHARQHNTEANVTPSARVAASRRMMDWLVARVTEGRFT